MYISFNNNCNCNQTFSNNNLSQFNHTYELNNSINEDIHFKNQSKKKYKIQLFQSQGVKSSYLKNTPIKKIKKINYQKK